MMKYLITESSRFKSLKVIREITNILNDKELDEFNLGELQPESNPSVGENDGEYHLVEVLYKDKVTIIVYNDDGMDLDEYQLPYEELELDTLVDILDILEGGMEEDLI